MRCGLGIPPGRRRSCGLTYLPVTALTRTCDPDIVTIDDTNLPMPMETMKMKSASLPWEFMFARAMHKTSDMIEQHKLLSWVAGEIESGNFRTTVNQVLSPINASTMREAYLLIETGRAKGKVVLEGFQWRAR